MRVAAMTEIGADGNRNRMRRDCRRSTYVFMVARLALLQSVRDWAWLELLPTARSLPRFAWELVVCVVAGLAILAV